MTKDILAPAAALVLWTLLVLAWMAVARGRGVAQLDKTTLKTLPRAGGRGPDLERVLPAETSWASHNYTHLLEQPTLFYATVLMLAAMGQGTGLNIWLAWGYVALRMAHSLWQILVNKVPVRFALFLASTACLIALAVNALRAALG